MVSNDSIILYHELYGTGSPLLLIAGLGCDMGFWRPFQIDKLSQNYMSIIYDNRGIGESDKPQGPYTIAQMADDAAALLSELEIKRAHVLGVSMGAMIALEVAIRHPEIVRSLIVACGIDRSDAWMKAKQVLNQELASLPVDDMTLKELKAKMNLQWMVEPSFYNDKNAVENVINTMKRVNQPLEAYCWQSQALHDHDATHGLGSIKCPTLVMVGKQDILTPVRYAETIAKAIPTAELQVIDGCGHLFMFEKPDLFNRSVLDFLEDVEIRETGNLSTDDSINIPSGDKQTLIGKIRRSSAGGKWALICRGLTGSLQRRSSLDALADALDLYGWSSLRFDYRYSLNPQTGEKLRTQESMIEDIQAVLVYFKKEIGCLPDAVVARGLGSRLALEALNSYPEIPFVMWAPIIWIRTSLELRGRLHEMRRHGKLNIDNAEIGAEFIQSLNDPSDEDIKSWVIPRRRHVIVYGEEDKVVPVQLAKEARDLIESTSTKVEFILVPGQHPHPKVNVKPQIRKIVRILTMRD